MTATNSTSVMFIHGFLSGGGAWEAVRRELKGVASIAPNLPGYGREGGDAAGAYDLESVVDHFARIVEREKPAHVVGHSMGAIVALALASRFAEVFHSVGVIGLPVYHSPADAYHFLRRRGLTTAVMLRDHRIGHASCIAMRTVRGCWIPAGALLTLRPRGALATMFDHSFESHAGGLDGIVFNDLVDGLADGVATPVAALHGGRDRSAPLGRVRALATRRGWSFKVAPTASHQLIFERPAVTARWVREQVIGAATNVAAERVALV